MTDFGVCATTTRFRRSQFTGKERDTESGNDYFLARYYSSALGRFTTPDWSAKEDPVPYAVFTDPQSLNLYGYVRNNPVIHVDADGHCCDALGQFVAAAANAYLSDNAFGLGRAEQTTQSGTIGAAVGDFAAAVQGGGEFLSGGTAALGGGAEALVTAPAALTGVGVVAPALGAAVVAGGVVVAAHGADTAGNAVGHLLRENNETGSYTNTHESGKTYDGKGDRARSQESGKRVEKETGDKHVSTDWKPAANDREAFKDESRRLDSHGGPQSDSNHNKRQSPGKKYRKQDGSH